MTDSVPAASPEPRGVWNYRLRRPLSFDQYRDFKDHYFKETQPARLDVSEDPAKRPLVEKIKCDIDQYRKYTKKRDAKEEFAEKVLPQMLNDIELDVGERWLGETTTTSHRFKRFHVHRRRDEDENKVMDSYDQLGKYADDYVRDILATAGEGPDGEVQPEDLTESRALLLLKLWTSCELLWERSLCYRTLDAVCEGVGQFALVVEHDCRQAPDGWPYSAFAAAAVIVRLTREDSRVFKAINRGDAKWSVLDKVRKALEELSGAENLLSKALGHVGAVTDAGANDPNMPTLTGEVVQLLLRAQVYCRAQKGFYKAIERATSSLQEFEAWTRDAPRFGSANPFLDPVGYDHFSVVMTQVSEGISDLDAMLKDVEQDVTLASRYEPWRQLLIDLRGSLEACANASPLGAIVLVPKQVSVLYCFPFAVDYTHGKRRQVEVDAHIRALDPDLVPPGAALGGQVGHTRQEPDIKGVLPTRLKQELGALFPEFTPEVTPLAVSAFWLGSGDGLYGGKKVQLLDVSIGGNLYRVWLVISRIGNHSLCVQPDRPMTAASTDRGSFPNDVYRALRLATPWAIGEKVTVTASGDDGPWWDDMHMFAHDVVLATARALTHEVIVGQDPPTQSKPGELPPYMPGNLHEVVTVQTDEPITIGGDAGARRLDNIVGAQVLVTSANRVASTLFEWLRDRAPSETYQAAKEVDAWSEGQIAPLPLIGFKGDWFVHTGDMTVFGAVAVPTWLSEAYIEVAQFAASWVPLLQLWTVRLQEVIRTAHAGDRGANSSEQLRIVDQAIRRQTSELRSPQLCQSQLHRRFLDIFLSESGVTSLERELDAQLLSAERLADWYDERRRRGSEDARNILLLVIGLFGVFGLASYLSLANGTSGEPRYTGVFRFLNLNPQTEVHIVLGVFVVFLGLGILLLRAPIGELLRKAAHWRRHLVLQWRGRRRRKRNQPKKGGDRERERSESNQLSP